MMLRASTVGELAFRILARGGKGEVTRVFPRSVYIRAGTDFLVLLWGNLRSPLTVNIGGEAGEASFAPGSTCAFTKRRIHADGTSVEVNGAEVYRSSHGPSKDLRLPAGSELASSVAMLRSLYDVSPGVPGLPADSAFREFVNSVLVPLAAGRSNVVYDLGHYRALVGRGTGFTPAGDDFLGGFAAAYGFAARSYGWKRVSFGSRWLSSKTIPESAAIMRYAARGYVDESMERLIIRSMAGEGPFHRELLAVARRGHTSGIDMSLGVLLCEAALKGRTDSGDALRLCLESLWKP
jgi:hypothetical protein